MHRASLVLAQPNKRLLHLASLAWMRSASQATVIRKPIRPEVSVPEMILEPPGSTASHDDRMQSDDSSQAFLFIRHDVF
jgi:hypothetical protein